MSISNNTNLLNNLLDAVNALPDAGSGGVELPTLSNPALEEEIFLDKQVIDETGSVKTGTFTIEEEIAEQNDLISELKTILSNKAVVGDDDVVAPTGTIQITENGIYDVARYASAEVNVPTSGGTQTDNRQLYQRVEYIKSAVEGTYPYIITDFYADNNSGIEVIASFPVMQDRIPMGSREDSGNTRFYCPYPLSSSSIYYGFNTGSSISCALTTDTIYRLQTNFLNSRLVNVYEEDGTRKASSSINATLTPHTVPVSIFGYNSGSSGEVTSKREHELYSARCSKGHEVVREYIPCYRKSDGVVGVYEKFAGEFLTTPTGAFTKGADIDW